MSCEIIYKNQTLTISVEGIFSFDAWIEFKNLDIDVQDIKACEVDFSKTSFIDSSGIGSLLILKEKVGPNVEIKLTNTNRDLHKIITTANLANIFTVS
jgi:HptB-dependent secretion and biofilm anti anti-sigma factor